MRGLGRRPVDALDRRPACRAGRAVIGVFGLGDRRHAGRKVRGARFVARGRPVARRRARGSAPARSAAARPRLHPPQRVEPVPLAALDRERFAPMPVQPLQFPGADDEAPLPDGPPLGLKLNSGRSSSRGASACHPSGARHVAAGPAADTR